MADQEMATNSGAKKKDNFLSDSAPISPHKALKSDTLKRGPPKVDLSRGDLVRLLSYLEGELQARDVVIATLKTEKAKQLLYQAKYGRLGLKDPLAALQRDSELDGGQDFDEDEIGRIYESQLSQLEKLISQQRRAHQRAKQILSAAERRHARTIRELETEKQRNAADAAHGDDVCMMLEKEREKLRSEMEYGRLEREKLVKEVERGEAGLIEEKERHQAIVFYLMNERTQLIQKLLEEKQKTNNDKDVDIQLMRGMVKDLKAENDTLRKLIEKEREESASIREIVRTQEEDLNLIRQNILAKTRQMSQQQRSQSAAPNESPTSPESPSISMKMVSGSSTIGRQPIVRPVHPSKQLSLNQNSAVSPSPLPSSRSSPSSHYASTSATLPPPGVGHQRPGARVVATSVTTTNPSTTRLPPGNMSNATASGNANIVSRGASSSLPGRILTNPNYSLPSSSASSPNSSPSSSGGALTGSGGRTTPFPVTSADFGVLPPPQYAGRSATVASGISPSRNITSATVPPGATNSGLRRQTSTPGGPPPPPAYASPSSGTSPGIGNPQVPSYPQSRADGHMGGARTVGMAQYRSVSNPHPPPPQVPPGQKRRPSADSRAPNAQSQHPHQEEVTNEETNDDPNSFDLLEPEIAHLEEVINSLGGVIESPAQQNGASSLKTSQPSATVTQTTTDISQGMHTTPSQFNRMTKGSTPPYSNYPNPNYHPPQNIASQFNLNPPQPISSQTPNNRQAAAAGNSAVSASPQTTTAHMPRRASASLPNGNPVQHSTAKRHPTPVPPFRIPLPPPGPPGPRGTTPPGNGPPSGLTQQYIYQHQHMQQSPVGNPNAIPSGIPIVASPSTAPAGSNGAKQGTGTIKRNPLAGMVGGLSRLNPIRNTSGQRPKKKATQV